MKLRWSLLILLGVLVILAVLPGLLDSVRLEDKAVRRTKRYSQVMAEDAVLNRHGVYGVDFVRCRRCSVEKLRRGPLTFGGLNALVLEGLQVVLPPRTNETVTTSEPTTAREVVGRMGLSDSFLRSQGASLRFSELRIEDLTVSLLRGTNVVRAFSAARAEAKRDGLHLRNCVIMRENTNRVSRAVLKVKPFLRLEWAEGEWDLD